MQATSTLTERYQTTVPRAVRQNLGLQKGDMLCYRLSADGRVYIEPLRPEGHDPALDGFLALLEADLSAHPERLQGLRPEITAQMDGLVGDMEVDLDAPLSPEDE